MPLTSSIPCRRCGYPATGYRSICPLCSSLLGAIYFRRRVLLVALVVEYLMVWLVLLIYSSIS